MKKIISDLTSKFDRCLYDLQYYLLWVFCFLNFIGLSFVNVGIYQNNYMYFVEEIKLLTFFEN